MSNTLSYLKNKANHLHTKLQAHEISVAKKHKQHLLAYILGFKSWDDLKYSHQRSPIPHTSYHLNAERLSLAKGISLVKATEILDEIRWPNEYIPVFNLLPVTEEGYVPIPLIFSQSRIFSPSRARKKKCLRERIAFFDSQFNMNKDLILYSGERLNYYDENIFYTLIYSHPAETPVGREFFVYQKEIALLVNRNISKSSLDNSIDRMMACRIEVPMMNFFGPLISNYRTVKTKHGTAYKISLNPELVKLYRDPLYGIFMDSGNLFHYDPRKDISNSKHELHSTERSIAQLRRSDFIEYSKQLGDLWPTHDTDVAAIWSIITKDASGGSAQFKLLQDVKFNDENDSVEVRFPDWFGIANQHFIDLYGLEAGSIIFMKAMKRFMNPLFIHN